MVHVQTRPAEHGVMKVRGQNIAPVGGWDVEMLCVGGGEWIVVTRTRTVSVL